MLTLTIKIRIYKSDGELKDTKTFKNRTFDEIINDIHVPNSNICFYVEMPEGDLLIEDAGIDKDGKWVRFENGHTLFEDGQNGYNL